VKGEGDGIGPETLQPPDDIVDRPDGHDRRSLLGTPAVGTVARTPEGWYDHHVERIFHRISVSGHPYSSLMLFIHAGQPYPDKPDWEFLK
jgi:hypothetical protein